MNNYRDEYGVGDWNKEAENTLEIMSEKLDTDCAEEEKLQGDDEVPASSSLYTEVKEDTGMWAPHAKKCRS